MSSIISIEVDTAADAAYINLSDSEIVRTVAVTDCVNVDLDKWNVATGIEVLGLATNIPWEQLVRDLHVRSEVVETVKRINPNVQGFMVRVQHVGAGVQSFAGDGARVRKHDAAGDTTPIGA